MQYFGMTTAPGLIKPSLWLLRRNRGNLDRRQVVQLGGLQEAPAEADRLSDAVNLGSYGSTITPVCARHHWLQQVQGSGSAALAWTFRYRCSARHQCQPGGYMGGSPTPVHIPLHHAPRPLSMTGVKHPTLALPHQATTSGDGCMRVASASEIVQAGSGISDMHPCSRWCQ